MSELHVVLGGSGGVGRAVVTRLAQQGKPVRAVNRSGQIDDLIDFKVAIAAEKMQIIGKKEPLHTYTYVYDFAGGLITLGEQDQALGEIWHIPSAPTVTTQQFLDMMYAETGTEENIQVGPKPILTVMSWFNPQMKPALEVFYQFDRPFIVDHSKYEKAFGATPTSHKEAIAQTVNWARQDLANGGH